MPTTVAGFLLLAGLMLFILSLLYGAVEYKDIKLPSLKPGGRLTVRVLGICFMLGSVVLYIYQPNLPMAPATSKTDFKPLAGNWLVMLDQGEFEQAWHGLTESAQDSLNSRDQFAEVVNQTRKGLGPVIQRDIETVSSVEDGILLAFESRTAQGLVIERILLKQAPNNEWKIAGYSIDHVSAGTTTNN